LATNLPNNTLLREILEFVSGKKPYENLKEKLSNFEKQQSIQEINEGTFLNAEDIEQLHVFNKKF